ncbi:MAG: class I SAM-dependent rRNA methyltransferase [Verrucomicrobiaceae bacterium]|nr:MAG: class I SAM-dependent rRNA methyltransferase [Verrucomicrobiaceae bacterium]
MGGIIVRPRSRILHGHDWVYSSEILKTFGNPEDGSVVSIKDGRDQLLGVGIYNSKSQIVVRRFSRRRQDLDEDFFRRRIAQAVEYRARAGCRRDLGRLVWSESDGLPGIIADRYGRVVVLQTVTKAMDMRKDVIATVLQELAEAECVIERNDAAVRTAEGLDPATGVLTGNFSGPVEIEAAGVRFLVDPLAGHKTGLYLDQIESYGIVAPMAAGRRVLDCFSNQGGFALACAKSGAASVIAVESGAESIARLRDNATRNGLEIEAKHADVFDVLARGGEFDLIILDPPSFTKARSKVSEALRGYRDLHARAARLLSKDGLLVSFSCSHHVAGHEFEEAIAEGLQDAKRNMRLLRRIGQPADHPVVLGLPETEYLKGIVLGAMAGR